MKVYISKYRNHWISPYTILEKTLFWKDWENIPYKTPWVKKAANVINPISVGIQWVLDKVHPQINYVKIDNYDTWSMDTTLSPIILPMLKQLRATKHGAPNTDDNDVPAKLRSTTKSAQKSKKNDWDSDGNHFKRWDYIMDEMIWAFEQLCDDDNDEQFWIEHGEIDWDTEANEDGSFPIKWKKKSKVDWKGLKAHHDRIQNGLRLFGVYYRNLWD